MNWFEILAALLGILAVWLTAKQNIWCWPLGIANATMYAFIFFDSNLNGDASLQLFYMVISYYGWYEWAYGGKNKSELTTRWLSKKEIAILTLITALGTFILYLVLVKTSSDLPFWDALTTVMSVVGTWMMAKKIIENWLVWIVADGIYIFMYIAKDLQITALLYFVFTVLAIIGFIQWRKTLKVVY